MTSFYLNYQDWLAVRAVVIMAITLAFIVAAALFAALRSWRTRQATRNSTSREADLLPITCAICREEEFPMLEQPRRHDPSPTPVERRAA
jgi:hypothetical protein